MERDGEKTDPAIIARVDQQPDNVTPRPRLPELLRGPFDIRSIALTGIFILAIFYTIYFMRAVLLPVVLALLLSYLLRPILRIVARLRISPLIGAALILLSVVGIIGYGVYSLATPVAGWVANAPYSLQEVQSKLMPLKQPIQSVAKASGEIEKLTRPDNAPPKTTVEVKRYSLSDILYVQTPELIVGAVTMLILLYFLLAYDGVFRAETHQTVADSSRQKARRLDRERHRVPRLTLFAHCDHYQHLPRVRCRHMTLGAILSFDSLGYALIFPAAYLILAILEGNFITPMVMGKSLTLNPVMVLLSLMFWGWMWGIAGIILAVPILASLKIFCARIQPLEPLAEFLS